MEIKIKNSIVLRPEFLVALERLLQSRAMPAKMCIEVNRVIDEAMTHLDLLRKSRRDITLRLCKKNEDGTAVLDAANNVVFPDDASKNECQKLFEDLNNEYLVVEMTESVTIYDDENVTPLDIRMLGSVVQIKERPKS